MESPAHVSAQLPPAGPQTKGIEMTRTGHTYANRPKGEIRDLIAGAMAELRDIRRVMEGHTDCYFYGLGSDCLAARLTNKTWQLEAINAALAAPETEPDPAEALANETRDRVAADIKRKGQIRGVAA